MGKVEWIGVRPERKAEVRSVPSVAVDMQSGLAGDHDVKPHRQVTLIAKESLDDVARALGRESVDPAATRRNIVVSGMDFDELVGKSVTVGSAIIELTGVCHPCSRMDENLGEGGRAALAEYGCGWTARIVQSGQVSVGDTVEIR